MPHRDPETWFYAVIGIDPKNAQEWRIMTTWVPDEVLARRFLGRYKTRRNLAGNHSSRLDYYLGQRFGIALEAQIVILAE